MVENHGLLDGDAVIDTRFEPDMGLFPPAAERALRFLTSYEIKEAIKTTEGPIRIATVGAGFPWIGAMQVNEHLKRCESSAKQITGRVNQAINNQDIDHPDISYRDARIIKNVLQGPGVVVHTRTAITSMLFNPPDSLTDSSLKASRRNKLLFHHLTAYFEEADTVISRKNEPKSAVYRRKGGWETVSTEPCEPLLAELVGRLGTVQKAKVALELLARTTTGLVTDKLRPFSVSILDTRSTEDLLAQAEVMYHSHPDVVDTELYEWAVNMANEHTVQNHDNDLSSLEDGSMTVVIVSHWPLRHESTGNADTANWAVLLDQLHRKLRTNGIAIFFPWSLPKTFDPGHPDVTLGGVQSMMINEYQFDVQITGEPIESLLASLAIFGQEPAMLTPQMRSGGNIGRLVARKRRTLGAILAKSRD